MASRTGKCLQLVKGRRLRVTKEDSCGRPVYGDDSVVVTSGFVSVAFSANTNSTDEINVPNANGDVCIYEPAVESVSGYGLEIAFCDVDVDLFSMATGYPQVLDANGNVIGFDVDPTVSSADISFGMELWAGVPSGGTCATGSAGTYGYLLTPFLQGGILGDFTLENGAVTFTLTGVSTKKGNSWGVGPYDVQLDGTDNPGPLTQAISANAALRIIEVGVAPPDANCGGRPLMDPDATAITAIDGTVTALSVDFATTPSSVDAAVYYEFGDGTWDYLDASEGGSTTHVYDAAGTYTVSATSNGTWVTTTVTTTAA